LENTSPSGGGEYRQWYLEEQYETGKRKRVVNVQKRRKDNIREMKIKGQNKCKKGKNKVKKRQMRSLFF
jgi:hypothetical protein